MNDKSFSLIIFLFSASDERRYGGGRSRDSLTGRRIKICLGNYKGSIGIVTNVKGQSLHVQLQSTGKTVIGKFLSFWACLMTFFLSFSKVRVKIFQDDLLGKNKSVTK